VSEKIGILAVDNGDYSAYVGFFDDPARLRVAVEKLNAERLNEYGDPAHAEMHVVSLATVPDVIDDNFLDTLAGMLAEAGVEIEMAEARKERLAGEAEDDAEPEPFVPSPGQLELPR
jgi:hypothetical protein